MGTVDLPDIVMRMKKLGIWNGSVDETGPEDRCMSEQEIIQFENFCQKRNTRRRELVNFLNIICIRQDPSGRCLTAAFSAGVPNSFHMHSLGVTPLILAAYRGFPHVARIAIDHGADLDATDTQGLGALYYVGHGILNSTGKGTKSDYCEIFQMLVEAKGDIEKCLHYELPEHLVEDDKKMRPLIFLACESGNLKMVKDLLNAGVAVNRRDIMKYEKHAQMQFGVAVGGETPLHFAVKSGNLKLVQFLLLNGADTQARSYGDQATLPVENIMTGIGERTGTWNMRVAHEIFRFEDDNGIISDGEQAAEYKDSDKNIKLIREQVDIFLKTGEATGEMASTPIYTMRTDGELGIEELSLDLQSKKVKMYLCNSCGKKQPDTMKCSQCEKARYCNKACQKEDWKKHKLVCKKD